MCMNTTTEEERSLVDVAAAARVAINMGVAGVFPWNETVRRAVGRAMSANLHLSFTADRSRFDRGLLQLNRDTTRLAHRPARRCVGRVESEVVP